MDGKTTKKKGEWERYVGKETFGLVSSSMLTLLSSWIVKWSREIVVEKECMFRGQTRRRWRNANRREMEATTRRACLTFGFMYQSGKLPFLLRLLFHAHLTMRQRTEEILVPCSGSDWPKIKHILTIGACGFNTWPVSITPHPPPELFNSPSSSASRVLSWPGIRDTTGK